MVAWLILVELLVIVVDTFFSLNSFDAPKCRYLQLSAYNVHTQGYHIKYAAVEYVYFLLVRIFRSVPASDEEL